MSRPTIIQNPVLAVKTNQSKASDNFHWSKIETEDYRQYVSNLRAIGCPDETIQDIILADVRKLFQRQAGRPVAFEFWRTGQPFPMYADSKSQEAALKLFQEKKALIKELLGIELPFSEYTQSIGGPQTALHTFSPEKQRRIEALNAELRPIFTTLQGAALTEKENVAKLLQLLEEKERRLGEILSPAELEHYHLIYSSTAQNMRQALDGFSPSEEEFRKIFKIQAAYDQRFKLPFSGPNPLENESERTLEEASTRRRIREVLGEARYEDYEKTLDPGFKSFSRLKEEYALTADQLSQFYQMKKNAVLQSDQIRERPDLTPAQKALELEAIKKTAVSALEGMVGQKGVKRYKYEVGSIWLHNVGTMNPIMGQDLIAPDE